LAAWGEVDFSPLCLAVAFDKLEIIELLLKYKANPNIGIVLPLSVACTLTSKNGKEVYYFIFNLLFYIYLFDFFFFILD